MEETRIRDAIAYFRKVPKTHIKSVRVVQQTGTIATVTYIGPKGRMRTSEFDLSAQYMKMFVGEANDKTKS
jgi:hypothetical protein